MRNKKVIYISITILLIIILGIIGLSLTKSDKSSGDIMMESETELGQEQELNEIEISEEVESLEEEEAEVSEEETETVEESLQEIEDRAVKTHRYYMYEETEYTYANGIEVVYIDVSNMADEIMQDKLNDFIQQKALNGMFDDFIPIYKGAFHSENELGELRKPLYTMRLYYSNAYLYGNILSMAQTDGGFSHTYINEIGEHIVPHGYTFFNVCNYDINTGAEVDLSDILIIGEEFYSILKNVDIRLYNEAYEANIYKWFMYDFENIIQKDNEYDIPYDYKWLIDAEGYLLIGEPGNEGPDYFKVPLSLFESIVKPGYEEYVKDSLCGYDFYYYIDSESTDSTDAEEISTVHDEVYEVINKEYIYEDDVKLEFIQIDGMKNVALQCKANDYILHSVLEDVVNDISYAYINGGYYSEDSNYQDRERLICVESVIPNHYLNGQILRFTHTEKVTRKAYTTEEGIRKEEISKGPYFQAFNYDIAKGKELKFGDVFEADDELFEIVEQWFDENSGLSDRDIEIEDDEEHCQNFAESIGWCFTWDMNKEKSREEFINGESIQYHWFIDQSEEGSNLCIYMYNTIDTEKKCLKIPMSILKDKIKPEYEDCF